MSPYPNPDWWWVCWPDAHQQAIANPRSYPDDISRVRLKKAAGW